MTQTVLELRILRGLHRGATVSLDAAGPSLRLGSDAQNDVVLRDASFKSLVVTLDSQGLVWDAQGEAVQVAVGQGIRLGPLALGLSPQDSDWTDEPVGGWAVDQAQDPPLWSSAEQRSDTVGAVESEELFQHLDGAASNSDAMSDPLQDAALGAGASASQVIAPGTATPIPVPSGRGGWARSMALGGALVGLTGLVGLGFWGWEVLSPADPASQAPAVAAAASAPPADDRLDPALLAKVRQVVDRLTPTGTVQVVPFAGGKVQLLGVTESDEKTEAIVRAASTVTPSLKLSLITQGEFAQRVKSLASSLPSGVDVVSERVGRLVVNGTVEDEAMRDQLKSLLAEEFPGASKTVMNVLTAKERAAQEARQMAARFPKAPTIAAVVSGARPYVVLPGGQKVQPGGLVQDLRLSSIEADFVVFEDRAGTRFKMPR